MKLQNKTAIVTGAAGKGMGRSIALSLAREGANVIINYNKSQNEAEKIAHYINENFSNALAIKANVFDRKECNFLVDESVKNYTNVDILVIGPDAGWNMETITELNTKKSLIDITNEIAPVYNFFPKVLPIMYKQNWGRIIGISLSADPPSPSYSYNVAKQTRTNALLAAANEAWKHNVTINVVSPGPVQHIEQFDEAINLCKKENAWLHRKNVTPTDIAETVVFLCSDVADFISGTDLRFKWK